MDEDGYEEYLAWERSQGQLEFSRQEIRKTKLKRRLDCGHIIDGSEPYRYAVWKDRARPIEQRTDCEACKRRDDSY